MRYQSNFIRLNSEEVITKDSIIFNGWYYTYPPPTVYMTNYNTGNGKVYTEMEEFKYFHKYIGKMTKEVFDIEPELEFYKVEKEELETDLLDLILIDL